MTKVGIIKNRGSLRFDHEPLVRAILSAAHQFSKSNLTPWMRKERDYDETQQIASEIRKVLSHTQVDASQWRRLHRPEPLSDFWLKVIDAYFHEILTIDKSEFAFYNTFYQNNTELSAHNFFEDELEQFTSWDDITIEINQAIVERYFLERYLTWVLTDASHNYITTLCGMMTAQVFLENEPENLSPYMAMVINCTVSLEEGEKETFILPHDCRIIDGETCKAIYMQSKPKRKSKKDNGLDLSGYCIEHIDEVLSNFKIDMPWVYEKIHSLWAERIENFF